MIPLTAAPDGVRFAVRVIPRARRTAIAGIRDGALLVRLTAAPVDGAANAALIAGLAAALDCAPRDITLVTGLASRHKTVRVAGMPAARIAARLEAILAECRPRR